METTTSTQHEGALGNNAVLKTMIVLRQAFVVASLLIIIGIVLTYLAHPYFIALPLLVAGGLLFSGTVGWCPMIHVLEHMPWNKRP